MKPDVESFLSLESSLSKRLTDKWRKSSAFLVARLATEMESGNIQEAENLINAMSFDSVMKGNSGFLELLSTSALIFGATRLSESRDTMVFQDENKPEIIPIAVTQFRKTLDSQLPGMRAAAYTAIRKGQDFLDGKPIEEILKAQTKKRINLKSILDKDIFQPGKTSINLTSSLQMSRLSIYGYALEAEATGVIQYQVNEQLDTRICPVCRLMHGKVFFVKDIRSHIDTVIRTEDVETLKQIAPWPRQDKASIDELSKMSEVELVNRKFHSPEYHPRCRGIIVASGKAPKLDSINRNPISTTSAQRAAQNPEIIRAKERLSNRARFDKNGNASVEGNFIKTTLPKTVSKSQFDIAKVALEKFPSTSKVVKNFTIKQISIPVVKQIIPDRAITFFLNDPSRLTLANNDLPFIVLLSGNLIAISGETELTAQDLLAQEDTRVQFLDLDALNSV